MGGFPQQPVLDDFVRANTGPPPSADWLSSIDSDDGGMKVVSNQLAPDAATSSALWKIPYHAPMECYAPLEAFPGTGHSAEWSICIQDGDTATPDRYVLRFWHHSGSGVGALELDRADNGVMTRLHDESATLTLSDEVGVWNDSGTIRVYVNGTEKTGFAEADSTYNLIGKIGLGTLLDSGLLTRFGAFGGGAAGVLYDTSIESVRTATTDPWTWTHTPIVNKPKGILVAAVHGVSATDHVSSVTYGGVAMSRVVRATDTATELGAAELWFLGSGIPEGAQTISADLASATTDDIHFISWSISANDDTEVIDFDSISENLANPTRTLSAGGRTKFSVAAMYAGGAAPGGTLAAGNTQDHNHDLGAFYSDSCRETTVDASDHTIGWSTLTADDLAFVAAAVAQVPVGVAPVTLEPAALTHTRTINTPQVNVRMFPVALTHTRAIYGPDLDTILSPAMLDHGGALHKVYAVLVHSKFTVATLTHTRAVYAPSVVEAITLLPNLLIHSRSTPSPAVSPQLRPGQLTHTRAIFTPTLRPALAPAHLTHTRAIFAPNVVVVVTPEMLAHTRKQAAPQVHVRVFAAALTHARQIRAPSVDDGTGPPPSSFRFRPEHPGHHDR